MNKVKLSQVFKEDGDTLEYATEVSILEFTSELSRIMREKSISKKSLADMIGTSPAYITKVLSGNANFSVATMSKFAHALHCVVHIRIGSSNSIAKLFEPMLIDVEHPTHEGKISYMSDHSDGYNHQSAHAVHAYSTYFVADGASACE